MDENNVHQFWGLTPASDLVELYLASDGSHTDENKALSILQLAPYDPRHTAYTLCRLSRHALRLPSIDMYVYEDCPEALARHMLLLMVLLDADQPPLTRARRFLELFGNYLLREDTTQYLDRLSHRLEAGLNELALSGRCEDDLVGMFAMDMLTHADRDGVVEAVVRARRRHPNMRNAWDARCRKWYGAQYDVRKNLVDWDYHMRLVRSGPAEPAGAASIINFHQFRHWRMSGVAYEVRNCSYTEPNPTLLSTAYGRTKEFKTWSGADMGRSVSALGLWCDVLCSPYHAFGTSCEDAAYFEKANREHKFTAVDVSERNILSLIHERELGCPMAHGAPHRAAAARGPVDYSEISGQAGSAPRPDGGNDASSAAGSAPSHTSSACEPVFRIHFLSGNLHKLGSRRKLAERFALVTVGHQHVHVMSESIGLTRILQSGARVVVERLKNHVGLDRQQVELFEKKTAEMASAIGLLTAQAETGAPGDEGDVMVFRKAG